MKIFRYAMMGVLMLGVSGAARAFTFQVLDPGNAPFPVEPGTPFAAQFGDCNAVDVPAGQPATTPQTQCFYAENNSINPPITITSLEMVIIDGPATAGQPADCDVSSPKSLFTGESCGFSGGVYTLDLTGGNITSGTNFVLVIDCDSSGNCPQGLIDATVNTNGPVPASTPEPSSLWMALSGTGALGYILRRRRRMLSI
ncbi:MAG TPA: PEP-CTERM sorting domain-containing protein [Bryocella sp.]|nr:PEP-CTERM sorting domain-containing protein [Bryocella sp.]